MRHKHADVHTLSEFQERTAEVPGLWKN